MTIPPRVRQSPTPLNWEIFNLREQIQEQGRARGTRWEIGGAGTVGVPQGGGWGCLLIAAGVCEHDIDHKHDDANPASTGCPIHD